VIDCATDSVVAAVKTGFSPREMAYVPRHNLIYVANRDGSSLTVINCRNDSVVRNVRLHDAPQYPLYNPERDEVLVRVLTMWSISTLPLWTARPMPGSIL